MSHYFPLRLAIRIRSGKEADSHMGRVEYNFNETENWQRLTSDNWTMNEAHVVCRETGYEKALEYINATNYPAILHSRVNTIFFPSKNDEETPKLWIGKCNGTEYSILRCNGASINTADRTDGVGVRCKHPGKNYPPCTYSLPCMVQIFFWRVNTYS